MAKKLKSCDLTRKNLKHLITFVDPCFDQEADGMGGFTSTEAGVSSCRARISPCDAVEIFENQQRKHKRDHEILLRWPKQFTALPRYNIYYGARRFRINGIINVEECDVAMLIDAEELEGADDNDVLNDLFNLYNTNGQLIFNTDSDPVFNTNLT